MACVIASMTAKDDTLIVHTGPDTIREWCSVSLEDRGIFKLRLRIFVCTSPTGYLPKCEKAVFAAGNRTLSCRPYQHVSTVIKQNGRFTKVYEWKGWSFIFLPSPTS